MVMNCREAESQIFAERDGPLDSVQRAALAAHVGSCAQCLRMQRTLGAAVVSLQSTARLVRVPDADLEWQKLRRTIRGGVTATSSQRRAAWFALPFAAAAALALALFMNPEWTSEVGGSRSSVQVARTKAAAPGDRPATVVFVDDQSGFVFVWNADDAKQL